MANRPFPLLVVSGALAVAGFGILAAFPAAAAGSSVNLTAHCSGSSVASLHVEREVKGRLSVDFGVDMARHTPGVAWSVTETRNGTTFVNTTLKTTGDGSFSITQTLPRILGTNTIAGKAVNPANGETCSISGSL